MLMAQGQSVFGDLSIQFLDPVEVGVSGVWKNRDIGRTQKRDRQDERREGLIGAVQRHDQAIEVDLSIIISADGSHDVNSERLQQAGGGFKPGSGIMIPGGNHDLQRGECGLYAGEERVKAFLRGGGWVNGIEDVTGDEQGIGLMLTELFEEPVEELSMFEVAIIPVEQLAKMPVSGVKNLHDE